MSVRPQVIALEEHYLDPEVKRHSTGIDAPGRPHVMARLDDVGQGRIAEMDAAGIDIQVLSHAPPGTQKVADPELAVRLARGANDRLAETVAAHPDRFAAFASLPTADPVAAAAELERAVTRLGFKGAMVHGLTNGAVSRRPAFLADFRARRGARRADLSAPVDPAPRGHRGLLPGLCRTLPEHSARRLGVHGRDRDAGHPAGPERRLEAHPRLKFIIGHFGEGLPFLLWRINMGFARDGSTQTWFRDAFCEHFWVTTSGFFSDPALMHCIQEIGIDRILFSVDYPFVENAPGTEWAMRIPLAAADREKILGSNAKRLLKLNA